jgi:hypothetical protein
VSWRSRRCRGCWMRLRSAGHPNPRLTHPAAQRLPRNFEIMTLCQLLGRECRSKVCVVLPHQSDRMIANYIGKRLFEGRPRRWLAMAEAPASRYVLNSRYVCRCVIVISSAAARAVNLSLSSRARTSRRFSSRLLITTMPLEMTASELPKRSRN